MSDRLASFERAILPGCALLIVLSFVTLTRADPDLWGHVRFGGDIIDSAHDPSARHLFVYVGQAVDQSRVAGGE